MQKTPLGELRQQRAEAFPGDDLESVQLIFTSPPYRHVPWNEYVRWLKSVLWRLAARCLSNSGSVVVVLGHEWDAARQVETVRPLEALIALADVLPLRQTFVTSEDRALLSPSVAESIGPLIERGELAAVCHQHAWWFGGAPRVPFGVRSSVVPVPVTGDDRAQQHPAAMPVALPLFFIRMLTEPGDLVLDPFAGSNATGFAAEKAGRRWVALETSSEHLAGAKARFGS